MAQITGSLDTPLPPHPPHLARAIADRVAATPDRVAFTAPGPDDDWSVQLTWADAGAQMRVLAAGLISLGLEVEDRVAIASSTRLEWILADGAVMLAGGATTTIYPSTGDEDVAYILSDSGARILVAEDQTQADKALRQRDQLPDLTRVVLMDGEGDGEFVLSWAALRERGEQALAAEPQLVEQRDAQITTESLATIIYTSGTTGRPKGVELPHRCWVFQSASIQALDILNPDDVMDLWLPLSHVFGKLWLSVQLQIGYQAAVDGRVDRIAANLPIIRPTVMAAVPRIFEKIHHAAVAKVRADGGVKEKIFNWAFAAGMRIKQAQREGRSPGALAGVQMAVADRLVFAKIRELTGGRMRYFVSGSAPLNGDVARWFEAAGLVILEGYGLTETSAPTSVLRPDDLAFGTVGLPLPGTEAMIAEDGEILLRGPHVMRGYRNRPEATAESLLPDGWFATGDVGEIDERGRIRITDRKKDLVKTSGGKYIAPGALEATFKSLSSLASNLVVHADGRNYATALVSLEPEALEAFAADRGLGGDFATRSQSPEVHAAIQADIDALNAGLNRWESIKRFTILDRDLSEEHGELTASLKVKRKVVEKHFADHIDAMYTG